MSRYIGPAHQRQVDAAPEPDPAVEQQSLSRNLAAALPYSPYVPPEAASSPKFTITALALPSSEDKASTGYISPPPYSRFLEATEIAKACHPVPPSLGARAGCIGQIQPGRGPFCSRPSCRPSSPWPSKRTSDANARSISLIADAGPDTFSLDFNYRSRRTLASCPSLEPSPPTSPSSCLVTFTK